MKASNNNKSKEASKSNQSEQIVKKDDLWLDCHPQPQKSQDIFINLKNSSSKAFESYHSTIQVKIEPEENKYYQYSQSKDSLENPISSPKKTKKIHKGHQQKETIDNFLYSNSIRKLVNIILKYVECLPDRQDFKQKYLKYCEINGDRQNIVILPFLVLDFFLEEIMKVYVQEMNRQKIIIFNQGLKQKINLLFTVLRGIFSQYKLGLQKSIEKKWQKKPCSEVNDKLLKTFIDMADYFNNKIPELFLNFITKKFLIRREDLNFLLKRSQQEIRGTQVKIEEQPTIRFIDDSIENRFMQLSKPSYSMSIIKECKKYIETIFPFKERQISNAFDRYFSIRFGFTYLRDVFEFPQEYTLDIKKILFNSKAEQHKRQSGRGKKASPYQMEKIYNRFKQSKHLENFLSKKVDLLGGQFMMALMVISLMKEKHIEVLNNFLASINKKIQYLSDQKDFKPYSNSQLGNQKTLKYKKSHYNHFIRLLSRGFQDKQIQKNTQSDRKNSKSIQNKSGICLRFSLSEWIYPPFFQLKNYLSKIQEQQTKIQNQDNLNYLKQMKLVYIKAQRQFEGQIQQDGITLVFDQQ